MQTKNILLIHEPQLDGSVLTCTYTVGNEILTNLYEFPMVPSDKLDSALVKQLLQWVAVVTSFGMFSIDYFDELHCEFPITEEEKHFFEKVAYLGLGEFRFVNQLDMNRETIVVGTGEAVVTKFAATVQEATKGALLLNGGGKDGSVSADLLTRASIPFTWFQRGNSKAQASVTAAWTADTLTVMRQLDPHRKNRKYQGHRPMSAGIAFLAILSAYLFGYSEVVASNEASANEGNLQINGFPLNHQYSKSFEFEEDVRQLLQAFGVPITYFSLLRPLTELQIALLASRLTKNQLSAITSCNNGTATGIWCMACAKCAFVALALTAAGPDVAEKVWGEQDIINKLGLRPHLKALLDPAVDKPLECVGMLSECQLAASMIVRHASVILDDETKAMLEHYASLRDQSLDEKLLTNMEKAAIPEHYEPVLRDIRAALHNWKI